VFEKLDKVRKLYSLPAAPKEVLAYNSKFSIVANNSF
jgi:hypothetical protein